jgi:uncharacterized surface protein with fasciclin (FAS1) repeats
MARSSRSLATVCCAALVVLGTADRLLAQDPVEPSPLPGVTKTSDAAPASTDILDTLARTEKFKQFLKAIEAAGLEGKFRELGPFTVFAPTDEAFAKLPKDTVDTLLADKARISAILLGHVADGKHGAGELGESKAARTLAETTLVVTPARKDLPWKVEHATVVTSDIATTNGVVHAIDAVLMPK